MATWRKLALDSYKSITVWRVWFFLGSQDVKTRFRRSYIGPLWIILNLSFFVAGTGLVYGLMFNQPMDKFLPYLTTGFVLWGYITSSIVESCMTFVNSEGYIKQFSYPKQIYLIRQLVVITIVLLIGLMILIPLQLYFGTFNYLGWLMAIPGLLIISIAALGHIAIFSYIGARFRDLPHALGGLLQVLFFVTPVMFPISVLKERHLDFVYQYNPLYYLMDVVRTPLLDGKLSDPIVYAIAFVYLIVIWFVAIATAKKLDSKLVFFL